MMIPPIVSKPIVVNFIIKSNIFIFILWMFVGDIYPDFMVKNFLISWDGVVEGRLWTLLTSVFSHNLFFHIFLNMYVFFGFGIVMESVLGPRRFLLFYLSAGITSSLCHAIVSAFLIGDASLPALGASGAIAGVIILFSLMFPKEKILFLGLIPVPALYAALLIVGVDLWGLFEQTQGGTLPIGHGAHLGGAAFGVAYYFIAIKHRHEIVI